MKQIKIFLSIIGALLLILVIFLVMQYYQKRDINFQMKMLDQGTTQQKVEAIEFIAKNKRIDKIPDIIRYIDLEDSFLYLGKDPYTLSCAVSQSLGKLTSLTYGETCNSSKSKTDSDILKIKQSWKDWYANEYTKWLKEQTIRAE